MAKRNNVQPVPKTKSAEQPQAGSGATSVQIRQALVETLRLDLVGPDNDHPCARELLPEAPNRWYLTGYLVPTNAPLSQRFDETSPEEIDSAGDAQGTDDAEAPEQKAASKKSFLPSSMGLSVIVPADAAELRATVSWGDYVWESADGTPEPGLIDPDSAESSGAVHTAAAPPAATPTTTSYQTPDQEKLTPETPAKEAPLRRPGTPETNGYRRLPRSATVTVPLRLTEKPRAVPLAGNPGVQLVVTIRQAAAPGLPPGAKAVSIFLVNGRDPQEPGYRAFLFQATLEVTCQAGFLARPDPRSWTIQDEWDQRVADLQYRDVGEYAVGHGVSAASTCDEDGVCRSIRSTWIPTAEVERVAPQPIQGVELGMETLGDLPSFSAAKQALLGLPDQYRAWIKAQSHNVAQLTADRARTAQEMLAEAETVADRISAGIALLERDEVREAFCIANRVVARAARQRFGRLQQKPPEEVDPPRWRPFQLAYLLMTLRGIVEPLSYDRETVDLLFFPTGGGKTEAYLGLSAFAIVLRRLTIRDAAGKTSIASAGLTVLMRYTLRLLTLDQLGRAAGLICALELERERQPERLGDWPFEIGLWVGQAATPNILGGQGNAGRFTAYAKMLAFKRDPDHNPAPIPLEECPWCGTKFQADSFRMVPNAKNPRDLRVHCVDHTCLFSGDRPLPIVAVDEPIYRRLPCFMIATVDKFASLPWTGQVGTLFGAVDRYDQHGFYGPCDPGIGKTIPGGRLPPPDLIIQDELHLISGPLGTVAGLYEGAIDHLSSREIDGRTVRPKVIASTATVRRADSQVRALFDRRVSIFPPPGPDRRDSFFARTHRPEESAARLYVGIAAQGRSLKVVLLRAALALLAAGQKAWVAAGGKHRLPNPADPYMTLLGYFNSLRELGGSRRIIEDEVSNRLTAYGSRERLEPKTALFLDRAIEYEVLELTSRVSTAQVSAAKRRLSLPFEEPQRVDVALATNMISVGLDITRLGLMVVLGQPKGSSEYIQATSRVGRDHERPGLVVTLLNIHKPRDRSHYERFTAYHASFYRHVEATSVTPYAPRALDRALAAVLVGLVRQGLRGLTPPTGAQQITTTRQTLDPFCKVLAERASRHRPDLDPGEKQKLHDLILNTCASLLDDWLLIAKEATQVGSSIQYQREASRPPQHLLYGFLDPEIPNLDGKRRRFRANRSMRDVEPNVEAWIARLKEWGDTP